MNDIISFWSPHNNDSLILASACNDGHIRLFSFKEISLIATIKGVFGQPLCLDVSKDSLLLAAGYEDDTFLLYSMNWSANGNTLQVTPVCRGLGHKSFVSQIKFDQYMMDFVTHARLSLE